VRILAVDTTTERASAAIVERGETLAELRLVASVHSTRLMPAVDVLLKATEGGLASIEGFAVATGPGSFTGLRVGISTIQGLALGHPRPCLGVSTLDVLAARARGAAETIAVMMDAWRDEVYGALYDGEGRLRDGPFCEPPLAFARRAPPAAVFIGAGARRYRDSVLAGSPQAAFSPRSLFLAATLGRLAEPRLLAGEGAGPESLRPLYLREAAAAVAAPR
jgi:tRNA threonylcarbamoyladenosine biosynthesis protein TsaB